MRFVVMDAPRQISRGLRARSKAAPLQALGTSPPREHTTLFEDEDEYEYEYDKTRMSRSSALPDYRNLPGFRIRFGSKADLTV
jgi:hypothetical protein